MSEQDLEHMLVRTSARLRRVYYVTDFLLQKWDCLTLDAKKEFLEALREDIANFLPAVENWHIFKDAPGRDQPQPPAQPDSGPASDIVGVIW